MGELLDKIYLQSIWTMRHPNHILVNQEALKQIVEQMKKEFPKLNDARFETFVHEVHKWLEKWLGGD